MSAWTLLAAWALAVLGPSAATLAVWLLGRRLAVAAGRHRRRARALGVLPARTPRTPADHVEIAWLEEAFAAPSAPGHGHCTPSRPPQQNINVRTEAALLAVRFEAREPAERCAPGDRFEAAGYNVGRCADCGQLAPTRTVDGPDGYRRVLVAHPPLDGGDR